MAVLTVNFMSEALMRNVAVNVILPVDRPAVYGTPRGEAPFRTLYLLHGVTGNCMDWLANTQLPRWAMEQNLAVVMPSGDNSFYLDQEQTHALYGEFIGRELVEVTRAMLPLSRRREDTFIAGLSMGGYGALRNGLKYADTFGKIGAFSAALMLEELPNRPEASPAFWQTRAYSQTVFGDLDKVLGSDKDPLWLLKQGGGAAEIYMACGLGDALYPCNVRYRDAFLAQGARVTFEEGPGGHDWDFWNTCVRRFLNWLEK